MTVSPAPTASVRPPSPSNRFATAGTAPETTSQPPVTAVAPDTKGTASPVGAAGGRGEAIVITFESEGERRANGGGGVRGGFDGAGKGRFVAGAHPRQGLEQLLLKPPFSLPPPQPQPWPKGRSDAVLSTGRWMANTP